MLGFYSDHVSLVLSFISPSFLRCRLTTVPDCSFLAVGGIFSRKTVSNWCFLGGLMSCRGVREVLYPGESFLVGNGRREVSLHTFLNGFKKDVFWSVT